MLTSRNNAEFYIAKLAEKSERRKTEIAVAWLRARKGFKGLEAEDAAAK